MEIPLKKSLITGAIVAASVWALGAAPTQRVADDPAIPPRVPAAFPATWRFPAGARATFAPHAIVASDSRIASEVGAETMKQGGNAVDAAVATGFALAVAYPEAGNLGGGGYMVIGMAGGRVGGVDFREVGSVDGTRGL